MKNISTHSLQIKKTPNIRVVAYVNGFCYYYCKGKINCIPANKFYPS